jgi:hypothetical protein
MIGPWRRWQFRWQRDPERAVTVSAATQLGLRHSWGVMGRGTSCPIRDDTEFDLGPIGIVRLWPCRRAKVRRRQLRVLAGDAPVQNEMRMARSTLHEPQRSARDHWSGAHQPTHRVKTHLDTGATDGCSMRRGARAPPPASGRRAKLEPAGPALARRRRGPRRGVDEPGSAKLCRSAARRITKQRAGARSTTVDGPDIDMISRIRLVSLSPPPSMTLRTDRGRSTPPPRTGTAARSSRAPNGQGHRSDPHGRHAARRAPLREPRPSERPTRLPAPRRRPPAAPRAATSRRHWPISHRACALAPTAAHLPIPAARAKVTPLAMKRGPRGRPLADIDVRRCARPTTTTAMRLARASARF